MDVEEAAERVEVAKPVASRPSGITFRPFSEVLAGAIAINGSSPSLESSQATVSAIRPKTVRFKPSLNRPPAPAFVSSQVNFHFVKTTISTFNGFFNSNNISGFSHFQPSNSDKIYKPMAKLVSKTAVSLLANMVSIFISDSLIAYYDIRLF